MQAPAPINREISRDPRPKLSEAATEKGEPAAESDPVDSLGSLKKGAESPSAGDRKIVERSYSTDSDDVDDSLSNIPQELEEDEEFRLAMELAMAAAQNPHLTPGEIQKLVGSKNKQREMVDEITKQKEKVEAELRKKESANGWWATAAKKAEEMKDRAERRLYAEAIRKDEEMMEMRKKMKILRKTLKAHRLQGNRVETRHAFKRQRMEKKLFQAIGTLNKTQQMFTNSSYNVQEYLKAMMKASKKWRKKGTDEELMLEAQLCRNMHQMLALEKQKVKSKKNTKELKKYLQRCKGWLSDKEAFCEMNLMTLEATQSSISFLLDDTLNRQDALIAKFKGSEEFQDVDLSKVDISHIQMPDFSLSKDIQRSANLKAMKGLAISDSIRVKKEHDERSRTSRQTQEEARARALEEAETRQRLVENYYKTQNTQNTPELYVEMNDDVSVSSRLSDPDASENHNSDSHMKFGDGSWVATAVSGGDASLDAVEEDDRSNDKIETTRADASNEDGSPPELEEAVVRQRTIMQADDDDDNDNESAVSNKDPKVNIQPGDSTGRQRTINPIVDEDNNSAEVQDDQSISGRKRTIVPIDVSESSERENTTKDEGKSCPESSDEALTTSTKSTVEPKE